MLTEPEIIQLNNMEVSVNWNEAVRPCQQIRFIIDGKECIISRAELYSLLFLFGDEEQQEQLIPVKSTEVSMLKRWVGIRLKRNMKKGEELHVMVEFPVEQRVKEKFQIDMAKEMKRSMTPMST